MSARVHLILVRVIAGLDDNGDNSASVDFG
jgi:hypothetical protein